MRPSTRLLAAVIAVGVQLLWITPCRAGEFFETDGVAIHGYDPVAYFAEHRAVQGSPTFSTNYKGTAFHFSSAANRDTFALSPDRYAPQYGGFCAYGLAKGYKASTQPDAFTIHQGKLYLNYSLSVREQWSENISSHVARADHNWPQVSRQSRIIP
jgi:YHS domain-containing protein